MEPGGYLRVVDRIKDVIKTGGEWVSSAQIEDLISQCKGVSEAAVIGVKDDKWGERPLALVIRDAQTGDDLSETQIKAHLQAFADTGVVSKYGIPDKILFVMALPKTSVGKFNKKELREKYGKMELVKS
jgi:fatty-acyl-CoA synthase